VRREAAPAGREEAEPAAAVREAAGQGPGEEAAVVVSVAGQVEAPPSPMLPSARKRRGGDR
jgi:hypothetical protein